MQSLSIRRWYVSLWCVTWSHRTRTIRLLGSFATPTPNDPQQQQTFHVQLLWLAYPDAINIEASAQRVAATGPAPEAGGGGEPRHNSGTPLCGREFACPKLVSGVETHRFTPRSNQNPRRKETTRNWLQVAAQDHARW